ncbi:hypothetical protein ACQP1U_16285 [Actinomycetota bacterium]
MTSRLLAQASIATLLGGAAIVAAAPAASADTTCRSTLTGRHIDGNLIVPSGATCTVKGGSVDGNVHVYGNAAVYLERTRVGGDVQGENHRVIRVTDSVVGGNIQGKQGLQTHVLSTRVNGDVQAFSNRSLTLVYANTIGGNLQCKSNSPKPEGWGNVVYGNKEDQCRSLTRTVTLSPLRTGTLTPNSSGRVVINGYAKVRNARGYLGPMTGLPIKIHTKAPGSVWRHVATTSRTSSTGYFAGSILHRAHRGHDVRLFFDSTYASMGDSYRTVGRVS